MLKKIGLTLAIILFIYYPSVAFGVMSSTNYTIFADTVSDGGILSSGGVYSVQDTIGESPAGISTSTSYEIRAGYQAMDRSSISISIDSASLDLGVITAEAVSEASASVTVTTDAEDGYSLYISGISGTHLADVADGSVTSGNEEYGLSLSGDEALFADDRSVAEGTYLSSTSTAITNSVTTLTFKASKTSATVAGVRSQSIVLTAAVNL